MQKASRGRKRGEECVPSPSDYILYRGLGSVVSYPQRGPGQSPGQKWILCIFEVRKKPPGTLFSVFLSNGGAPQMSQGPKTFSLSPS